MWYRQFEKVEWPFAPLVLSLITAHSPDKMVQLDRTATDYYLPTPTILRISDTPYLSSTLETIRM